MLLFTADEVQLGTQSRSCLLMIFSWMWLLGVCPLFLEASNRRLYASSRPLPTSQQRLHRPVSRQRNVSSRKNDVSFSLSLFFFLSLSALSFMPFCLLLWWTCGLVCTDIFVLLQHNVYILKIILDYRKLFCCCLCSFFISISSLFSL